MCVSECVRCKCVRVCALMCDVCMYYTVFVTILMTEIRNERSNILRFESLFVHAYYIHIKTIKYEQ